MRDIRIRLEEREDSAVKARASLVIGEPGMEMVVKDIKIIENKTTKELFLAMPVKSKSRYELAHPVDKASRENITKEIITAYEKALEEVKDIPTEV